ncbi:MAG: NAD(P)-dependent glycerol-3-phosphate dehydrogenase [Deltaproteobacteria bacterium]|nr:NAD(P)-dependent glycerol-3-phosphate dehydrogenase [Deltaproteobacteria bacterium]MBW2383003.1 NAD(P)-dependent glycerol-3-phosphate dehydrogenase [Deltaproteobacteria bacterium]MBW2695458.1 NAD(P)-dependent glycerol-3-phosphate dehydrogenase [Deltaproteobacteria bacterium]
MPIGVIGAGSFGTCLAMLCAAESDVTLWARDPDVARAIQVEGRNPRHLSQFALPAGLTATADLQHAVAGKELVVVAVPSHALRDVMRAAAPALHDQAIVVSAVKGIECETMMTMHEVLEDVLDPVHHPRICCLSGPSFALEIAERQPTLVTVACRNEAYAIAVQSILSRPWFRCYSSADVMGVEIGGALKNVIAIAVGIGDGVGAGQNARAALMTRGLSEMTRLAVQMGARAETLHGLSGMGDLVLTCTGDLSRNRRVGLALGEGRSLDEIVAELGEVAEGVRTTRAACRLAEREGVELPIVEMVRQVLDGERTPADAGSALLTRQLGRERESDPY